MPGDDLSPALATSLRLSGSHRDNHWQQPKFVTLPIETILRILCYAGPRDLIRLRAVCNRLHDIIDDPSVWREAYTSSHLPLPPGPFPWQSNRTIQRALVESDRLGTSWTSQPLTLISQTTFDFDSVITGPKTQLEDKDRFVWIRGRWLLLCRQMKKVVCRDVETKYEQILWEGDVFSEWAACSVVGDQGHLIYVAMRMGPECRLADPMKLVEFAVDDDTGRLTGPVIYDVPTPTLQSEMFDPQLRLASAHSPLVGIFLNPSQTLKRTLVFDSRTRRFYKYPPFRSKLDDIVNYPGAWLPHLIETYPTATHILVLSRSWLTHGDSPGMVEVLQTFAVPDDADAPPDIFDVRELRLTHEYLTRNRAQMSRAITLIRNSVVDPVEKTTTLRYLHTFVSPAKSTARFVCTDYILHDTPTTDVGPILVESHEVFRLNGAWQDNFIEASDEGCVRGLTTMFTGPLDEAHKYEMDATGERCSVVIGDPSPLALDLGIFTSPYQHSFDGFRGKFWFTEGDTGEEDYAGEDDDVLAYVFDFK